MTRRLLSAGVAGLLVLASALPAFSGTIKVSTNQEAQDVILRIQAGRFLDIATFGATRADTDALVARMKVVGRDAAFGEWIDQQFQLPATYTEPLALQMMADDGIDPLQTNAWVQRYRHHTFFHNAMAADDQLRQRVAWALIQICVVNDSMFGAVRNDLTDQPHYLAPLSYYDMLIRNSLGNYSDVLMDVTRHPVMGRFLSHLRNRKANPAANRFPDENYAREIMQLFAIGLYELNEDGTLIKDAEGKLVPTYDNEDIKAFARVFTGFSYAGHGTNFWGWPDNSHDPMAMFDNQHDTDEKVLLNGTVLPAGQTGMQDVQGAIDNLMDHPSSGPFVIRRLIQRLVKSNPTKGHIYRVVQKWKDNGQGVRGDMKAVIKAILMDQDVLNGVRFTTTQVGPGEVHVAVSNNGTEHSRFKEPVVRYLSFLRKFRPQSDYPTGRFMMSDMRWHWTQGFLRSPSVFNFYLPDFQPPGDIVGYEPSANVPNAFVVAPEFELFTAVTANRTPNRYRSTIYNEESRHSLVGGTYNLRCNIALDFSDEKALAADPAQLVQHLNILMAHGMMSDESCQTMTDALTEESVNTTTRTRAAILGFAVSPSVAVGH